MRDKEKEIYIGSTNDLRRRLSEHQNKQCYTTKRYKDIKLEAYIAVSSESVARRLEKYLKTGSGKVILKRRILTDEVLT